jgi:hypothetical protein
MTRLLMAGIVPPYSGDLLQKLSLSGAPVNAPNLRTRAHAMLRREFRDCRWHKGR